MKSHFLKAIALSFPLFVAGLAHGNVFEYTAALSGATGAPISPGTGFADVFFNNIANTLEVKVTFAGLTSGTTASHIHAPTATPGTGNAGVATTTPTFPGFPLGVTSGTYDHTLDLTSATSYNPAFVTAQGGTVAGAEEALVAALNAGESYLNIHTSNFPGGEIRGYLAPATVPEVASTGAMITLAMLAMSSFARYRCLRN